MTAPGQMLMLDCPDCVGLRDFEVPPCADEHAPCPELICVECGTALLVGTPPFLVAFPVVLARTA